MSKMAATTALSRRSLEFVILKMSRFCLILVYISLLLCLNLNICCGGESKPNEELVWSCSEFLKAANGSELLNTTCREENKSVNGDCDHYNHLYSLICGEKGVNKDYYCESVDSSTQTGIEALCADVCQNKIESKITEICLIVLNTTTKITSTITTPTTTTSKSTPSTSKPSTSTSAPTTTVLTSTAAPVKIAVTTKQLPSTKPQEETKVKTSETQDSKNAFTSDIYETYKEEPSSMASPPMLEDYNPVNSEEQDPAVSNDGHKGQEISTFSLSNPDDGNGHFFVYFLTVVVLCILGYVLYHNKKKVIAMIVEGRQERRRRPNTNLYRKLDTNLEEVMHNSGADSKTSRSNVIY